MLTLLTGIINEKFKAKLIFYYKLSSLIDCVSSGNWIKVHHFKMVTLSPDAPEDSMDFNGNIFVI